MKKFFFPRSIAVAGITPDENKISSNIIRNLIELGYTGRILPIGKKAGKILGHPIYPSLKEINEPVDLLVIMVPAVNVPEILREAGISGIDRVIIISDGFNESGDAGASLAAEIKEIAGKYSIRFIGPNCQGIICSTNGVCVPFAPLLKHQVKKGWVSIVTQSGSIGWIGAASLSHEMNGINKVASIGNKLDVNELDLLEYLIEDPETKIIVIHLESFSNGRTLFELASNSSKPVIVFKSNVSGKKSKIAYSHTAALASDDRIADAALAQAGILRAYTLRETIEMCKALSLPLINGNRIAVIAGSGGLAIIGEDAVQRVGLSMAILPEHTLKNIEDMGQWHRSINNPVDIGGFFDNRDILDVIDKIVSLDEVDGVILSMFNTKEYTSSISFSEVIDQIEMISRAYGKPIAIHFVSDHFPLEKMKEDKGFPVFLTIEDAVQALSTLWKYRRMIEKLHSPGRDMTVEKKRVQDIFVKYMHNPQYPIDRMGMEICKAYGLNCEIPVMVADLAEARQKAGIMGYPVVMKLYSHEISHKTDIGGVITDINDEAELDSAFKEIIKIKKDLSLPHTSRIMLQKMIPGGIELILGGKYDKDFGPVVMFGRGGIYAEEYKDISFRLCPICIEEAYEMVKQTRVFSLLKGVRGEKSYDIAALSNALERLSIMLNDFPEIVEIDINPVKIFNDDRGLIGIDGRLNYTG